METDSLMEGLVNTQIARVGAHCRQPSSLLLPELPLRFKRNLNICQIGMNKSPKSLKSITASVQRLNCSELGHFNNTLPSKGYARLLAFAHFMFEGNMGPLHLVYLLTQ